VDRSRLRRAAAEVVFVAVMVGMVCVAMPSLQGRALVCKAEQCFKQVRAVIVNKTMATIYVQGPLRTRLLNGMIPYPGISLPLCQAGFPYLQRFHSHRDWCLAPRGSRVFIYLQS